MDGVVSIICPSNSHRVNIAINAIKQVDDCIAIVLAADSGIKTQAIKAFFIGNNYLHVAAIALDDTTFKTPITLRLGTIEHG